MADWQLYRPGDYTRLRWKNGLGYTTELLRENLDGDAFAWRLSIARVTQDGPFSDFDGYTRTLLLLKGRGITLQHGDVSRQVLENALDAARFAGGGPTTATLHDGPIEDFNIMTRDGVCSARVHTGAATREWEHRCAASPLLVYASGEALAVSLDAADPVRVPPAHLLRVEATPELTVQIAGSGYIAVDIIHSGDS